MLNIRSGHLEARDNVRTMPERGRQILFSVSVGTSIVRNVVLVPCVLHDRLQQGREFYRIIIHILSVPTFYYVICNIRLRAQAFFNNFCKLNILVFQDLNFDRYG